MNMNLYFLELHARYVLEEARAARARAARVPVRESWMRPALRSLVTAVRALYVRATRPRGLAAGTR